VLDSAFVARLLAAMPPDLAARFDARMLLAVQQAFGPWNGVERRRGRHLRLYLPFGRWRLSLAREDEAPSPQRPAGRPWLLVAGGFLAGMATMAAGLALGG
jgi:hypothetical protein